MSTTARTPRRTGILNLARREWYMTRLEWSLRELPTKESRGIRTDLRRSLKDSAEDVGMGRALADLGSPDTLAQQYRTEADLEGPRWSTGALAAGLVVVAIVCLFQAYAFGVMDTLVEMGGGTRTIDLWGSETVFVGTSSEYSMEMNILPAFAVMSAISAGVFLLFSRIWRMARA